MPNDTEGEIVITTEMLAAGLQVLVDSGLLDLAPAESCPPAPTKNSSRTSTAQWCAFR